MKKLWLVAALLVLGYGAAVRAEGLGFGGGLMAYPLDLRGLKAELAALGASPGSLAQIPDFAPLPHLLIRGRLGLPVIINWAQLEVGQLVLTLPLATGSSLSLGSTAVSFGLLGELKALFFGLVLGLGTELIQGQLSLSSTDPGMARLIDELGLTGRSWSIAAGHGSLELEFVLGPVRLYFEGKYLHVLSQSGLTI
ncbi:MAG: hypothetical protein ACUVRH_06050, partial [Candidatus Bipolaricaulia bacterium]